MAHYAKVNNDGIVEEVFLSTFIIFQFSMQTKMQEKLTYQ